MVYRYWDPMEYLCLSNTLWILKSHVGCLVNMGLALIIHIWLPFRCSSSSVGIIGKMYISIGRCGIRYRRGWMINPWHM